jgi:tetratricopeptide (TPR) repeat protein
MVPMATKRIDRMCPIRRFYLRTCPLPLSLTWIRAATYSQLRIYRVVRLIKLSVRSSRYLSARLISYLLLSILLLPSGALAQKAPAASSSVETLIREGKLDQASRDLQAALQKNPNDVHALTLLGSVRRKQGNYRQAESLWMKAAQSDPNAIEPVENVAKLYAAEDRVDEAVQLYEALLGASPNAKFQSELADLYQKQGKYQKSLDLAQAVPANSRPDHVLVVIVADYIGLKRTDALQKAVDDVVHRAPANPDLIPQLANVLLDHGMVPDATELLRLAGKHQRITANYLAALAKAQAMSGQREQAQTTIAKALQLDPKSRDALIVAGRMAGISGNWSSAMSYLQRAQKTGPPTPDLLQNLVLACMRANDLQAAHNAALDLLEIQPESPDAALTMCAVLIRAAHWGEADPLVDKVLAARPGDKKALVAKGVVDYNLGRIDDAQRHLTASLGEGSGDAEANYYLGLVAKQNGDLPTAANFMESSLKSGPDNVSAMTALGQVYLALGDAEKARPVLEQAASKVPKDSQTHYQLALAYKKLGLSDKAREQMALFQQLSVRQGAQQPVGHVMDAPK